MLGELNTHRGRLVIQTLRRHGVAHFCFAPGSRSTSLMLAISELPKEERHIHFDERGLGFLALGIAKASKKPVAILVTSGTAVANLFPAICEAHLTQTPLIVITADRPIELRDCGANQTLDQVKMFASHTSWATDLPLSDPLCPDAYIASCLCHALYKSMSGPVHINCMLREPFFSQSSDQPLPLPIGCYYEPTKPIPPLPSLENWAVLLSQKKRGVILLGANALQESAQPLLSVAAKLGWPIFSDIISGGRKIGAHPFHIEHLDLLLKVFPHIQVDAILHIGDRIVSKTVAEWIKNQSDAEYFSVNETPLRYDPLLCVRHKMECREETFSHILAGLLPQAKDPSEWILFWRKCAECVKEQVRAFFTANTLFLEPAIVYSLQQIPSLFFANSMPIRDADIFLFPEAGIPQVFANRGVSGIDGNIATSIGIAISTKSPLVAVLGDLTALHDINSLAIVRESPAPIIFVVIHNRGGRIFSFLPIAQKKEIFEECVATAHHHSLAKLAQAFCLPTYTAHSLTEWTASLQQALNSRQSCLIECTMPDLDNVHYHELLYSQIKTNLTSSTSLLENLKLLSQS